MTYIPRQEIEQQILDAAAGSSPSIQILQAPRGAGKSSLLRQVASRLAALGALPVLIDIERICTSPADFARYFPGAIGTLLASRGIDSSRLQAIRRRLEDESGRRRPDPALLLQEALEYPDAAARASAAPLVLLLDEFAEATRLGRHAGLRDAPGMVARSLGSQASARIVATVSPASRPASLLRLMEEGAAGAMTVVNLPPMTHGEMATLIRASGCPLREDSDELESWMRATGGRPLYAEILARRVATGCDLTSALAFEMTPPAGALYQECRFDYHLLVERSRGHSVVRTILALLCRQEGMNLSGIARHLRIQLPTALDYLSWLLEVGLIRRDDTGYVYTDPLLRLWVRLNGPEPADLLEEVVALLQTPRAAPRPPSRPRGRRPGHARSGSSSMKASSQRRDLLMEID
jgi:regulatory ArsR family protein